MSFHSLSDTHSLLHHHHHHLTPSSAAAVCCGGTPRPSFLKINQLSNSHSLVAAPLRLSALSTQLPSEEGDELNASALPSHPQVLHSFSLLSFSAFFFVQKPNDSAA
jgi:hypothetical protein